MAPGCQERQSAELQRLGKGEGSVGPTGGPPQVQGDLERGQALAHFERLRGQASLQLSSLLWVQQHPRTHHDPCSLRLAKKEKEPSLLVSPLSDPLPFSDIPPGAGGQESG